MIWETCLLSQDLCEVFSSYALSLPRYQSVWSVHTVLNFIRSNQDVVNLSLNDLTLQLTLLLCLLSGQRRQTNKALRIDHVDVTATAYTFNIIAALKQTRPGFHQPPIVYENILLNRSCVFIII